MSKKKVALVVGAQGVIGRNLAGHLLEPGDWDVIGISRRPLQDERMTHVAVDLLDEADIEVDEADNAYNRVVPVAFSTFSTAA